MLCIYVLLLEAFFLNLLVALGTVEPSDSLATFLILIFSLSYAISIALSKKYKHFWKYMLGGYLLRLFFLYFNLYGSHIYVLPSTDDSGGHWGAAVRYARGFNIPRSARKPFGLAVRFLGEQRLLIQFIMVLSALITFIVVLKILNELKLPQKVINISMFLISMLPNYALHSSLFLMEAFPTMFSAIALLFFVRWYKGEGEINFYYTFIAALTAAFFHTGIITALAGYLLVRMIYTPRKDLRGGFHLSVSAFLLGGFFLIVFIILFRYVPVFSDKIPRITSISQIDPGRNWEGRGAKSGYSRYVGTSDSVSSLIIYTPLRIIFFLFSPMPLPIQIRGLSDIIAFAFGSSFYMYTYYKAIRYIRNKKNKYVDLAKSILIVGLITAFVFGWGRADVGTVSRHREKLVAVYVVLFAISMTDEREKPHRKRKAITSAQARG